MISKPNLQESTSQTFNQNATWHTATNAIGRTSGELSSPLTTGLLALLIVVMLLIIIPLPVIFDMLVGLVLAAVLVIIILAFARVPILLCSSALLVCPGLLELHVLRYLTSWRSARGSFLRLLNIYVFHFRGKSS